jgi:hypothetical protein
VVHISSYSSFPIDAPLNWHAARQPVVYAVELIVALDQHGQSNIHHRKADGSHAT